MAALIGVIFVAGLLLLPRQLGKAKSSKTMRELFGKSRGVNLLAAARIFMFGARDVWFVVGLPVFLYAAGWNFIEVGGFLAAWTIAYGVIQAAAPALVARSADGLSREVPHARLWAGLLAAVPVVLALLLRDQSLWRPDLVLVVGLALFGAAVRGEFLAALLPDPGLCRLGEGRRGCRLLLCRQRGRAADRHPAVRRALSGGRHDGLPRRVGGHAARLLGDHVPAAGRRRPPSSASAS